ncbi:SAM-dependent methyltransferase TehB [Pasteurellaceae bacterium HPA106]|uniref:SAM-dependent methyltransferase TehB n=1 Tax=Spirabiliibacterium pneumoniae TaxID=221400 RepID=UPI001AAD8C85|nr:SAM-dependent methyltransferase TehB [Spirabiliibacterium pneumoniae]MBE2896669.1 SAM-dependent methyltransferase TehB [Spirabiliibacterium pneumoniae]
MTPSQLVCYKKMPVWSKDTLPEMFQKMHNTKVGTWAKLTILNGSLKFYALDEQGNIQAECVFDKDNQAPFVEPQQWHRVEPLSDDLECYLEFYCELKNFGAKKYNMTATHSDVVRTMDVISQGKALDLGCGQGRNALFLAKMGFDVDAYDRNEASIAFLNNVKEKEQLDNLNTAVYDITEAAIQDHYDLIISTVVLMFLPAKSIPRVLANMQDHTNKGGYNLIVAAMSTDDYPCPMPFPFTFKAGELKQYYQDWEIVDYNENIGELHKTDENGNRIKLRFATLLAKKR